MLGWRRDEDQPAKTVLPNRHDVAGKTGCTCAGLQGVQDLLLLNRHSQAEVSVNKHDNEIHVLDIEMGNLKLFHDSEYRTIAGQSVTASTPQRMFLMAVD